MLRSKKGFTLIELMIVVAIIGILAAIAIPNFLKFQAKSKTTEVKSNIKAFYTANASYYGENNRYGGFQDGTGWQPIGTKKIYGYSLTGDVPTTATGGVVDNVQFDSSMGVTKTQAWNQNLEGALDSTGAQATAATPALSTTNYVLGGAGDIYTGTLADCWTVNDNNLVLHTNDPLR